MLFDTLGIDIGAESVKMALLSGGRVTRALELPYPPECFHEGWIANAPRMGGLIRNALKEQNIRVFRAAVQLSGDISYVHSASMPVMSAKQLDLNLRFAFSDYINDDLERYVYDYAMLDTPKDLRRILSEEASEDGAAKTMDFLAVAAPKTLLNQCREMLSHAKMWLSKAAPPECSCIALVRAAQENAGEGGFPKEYCILDLGSRAIRMYIVRGERHMLTRILEVGLRAVDAHIAQEFRVRTEDAGRLFRMNHENCHALEPCIAIYNDIALQLMRAINFYRFSYQDSEISDLWLIGGGAAVRPLVEILENTLDMRTHRTEDLISGVEEIEQCHCFAQAIGAALC